MGFERLGLIHIYTGEGKSKTTTSMGMAMRAVGQSLRVHVVQFLKGGAYTGELIAAGRHLPNLEITQFGKPCVKEKKQVKLGSFTSDEEPEVEYYREDVECGPCRYCFLADEEEKRLGREAFEHSKKVLSSGLYQMVILDEINVSIAKGIISIPEALELISMKPQNTELVLTGRGCPPEVMEVADYVTETKQLKHPIDRGIYGRRGVEY